MFYVGQKVVCVDVNIIDPGYRWEKGAALVHGRVYTINSTFFHPNKNENMVRLEEVRRGPECIIENGHNGYFASRFRPVVERKTDISIFKAMLSHLQDHGGRVNAVD